LLLRHATVDWQVIGIALARAVPNVVFITPVFLYLLMQYARVSLGDLAGALRVPTFSSLSIVAAVYLFRLTGVAADGKPILLLILEIAVGGIVGGAVLLMDEQLRGIVRGLLQRVTWFSATAR
jgi:hypothetical protein